jgi:hypothetical protein
MFPAGENKITLDPGNVRPGVYFVTIRCNGKIFSKAVLKGN